MNDIGIFTEQTFLCRLWSLWLVELFSLGLHCSGNLRRGFSQTTLLLKHGLEIWTRATTDTATAAAFFGPGAGAIQPRHKAGERQTAVDIDVTGPGYAALELGCIAKLRSKLGEVALDNLVFFWRDARVWRMACCGLSP